MTAIQKRLRRIAVLQPAGKRVINNDAGSYFGAPRKALSDDEKVQRHRDAAREYAAAKRRGAR